MDKRQRVVVVDVEQRRPACALLQAVFGGDGGLVSELFHGEAWLTAPTDKMRRLTATKDEWKRFAELVNKRFPMRSLKVPKPRRRSA
jgi:hypothetical protein